MIAKILGGFLLAALLGLGALGYLYRAELRAGAALAASLKTATSANDDLVKDRDRHRAEAAAVQAQANRLTLDLRALQARAATFSEALSDAAKNCPLLDADRLLLHCLLNPGTDGCGADGTVIAR